MLIETAAAFVSTATALSTVVDAIRNVRTLTNEVLIRSEKIQETPEHENDSVQALAATNIDDELVEIASEAIQKALDRLKREWRDPTATQAGKDDALENASFVICAELRRIKQLNGGVLPGTDRFHQLWASHGCDADT